MAVSQGTTPCSNAVKHQAVDISLKKRFTATAKPLYGMNYHESTANRAQLGCFGPSWQTARQDRFHNQLDAAGYKSASKKCIKRVLDQSGLAKAFHGIGCNFKRTQSGVMIKNLSSEHQFLCLGLL